MSSSPESNKRTKPRWLLRSTGAVLWLLMIPALWITWHSRIARSQETEKSELTEKKDEGVPITLPELPPFELTAHTGDKVTRDDLLGAPWVAGFVFTRCASTCPQISRRMLDLQKALGDDNKAQLVSITVDPTHDTPDLLNRYAENFGVDPKRWRFLTGEREDVYRLATVNLGMFARELFGKDRRPGFEVAHTNRVVLVNAEGVPVRSFLAIGETGDREMLALLRILQGKRPFPDITPPSIPDDDDETEHAADSHSKSDDNSSTANSGDGDSTSDAGADSSDTKAAALPDWLTALPKVNAGLNTFAAILLLFGFGFIKSGKKGAHKACMLSAFAVSIAFLACYVAYHQGLKQYTGAASKSFAGTGGIKAVYYAILVPHIILAAAVPILASITIYRGLTKDWAGHRKMAKITFPIWLYVSVTGLIIYLMLYHWPTGAGA